jgi:hypothetical protein
MLRKLPIISRNVGLLSSAKYGQDFVRLQDEGGEQKPMRARAARAL